MPPGHRSQRQLPIAPSIGALPRPFGPKYHLLRHLATGGMADVFLARQIGASGFVKECVIKRILPSLSRDRQFVTMFLDEARLCARLNHPNIAQVYDHGQIGDDYFIAMEYVDGVDLEQILHCVHDRGEQRMAWPIAARIVAGVADGLEHAHRATDEHGRPLGLVHRDVTPSNVMVSFEGVPKLLDFGIAKAAFSQAKTETGVIKGKVPYMSPEQVQGEPLDARSDLFSLGAIAYQLTTGEKPFAGENAAQVSLRILHDEPARPSVLVADYPERLEAIVLRALAKRAADRTPRARQIQAELERYLVEAGTPVTSHDVAAYLDARFSHEPIALSLGGPPTDEEPTIQGADPPMNEDRRHRPRPTGPLTIGEPPLLADLPDGGRKPQRRNLGGGGRWTAVIIAGLVVATGSVLFLLRGYELKREGLAAEAEVVPPPARSEKAPAAARKPPPAAPAVPEKPHATAPAPEVEPPPVAPPPAAPPPAPARAVAPAPIPVKVTALPAVKSAPKAAPPHRKPPPRREAPAAPTPLPTLPRLGLPAAPGGD